MASDNFVVVKISDRYKKEIGGIIRWDEITDCTSNLIFFILDVNHPRSAWIFLQRLTVRIVRSCVRAEDDMEYLPPSSAPTPV